MAAVLQNWWFLKFRKFHRKTPVLEPLFNKVAALQTWNFITTPTQVFSCENFEISETNLIDRTLPVSASEFTKNWFFLRWFEKDCQFFGEQSGSLLLKPSKNFWSSEQFQKQILSVLVNTFALFTFYFK